MKKKQPKRTFTTDTSTLYEALQLEAIEGKLTGSLAFFERKVRRWFSEKFSTPLLDTYHIPWSFILLHYYEDAIDSMNTNEVFDKAVFEYLPEFKKQAEQEDIEFAQSLLEEQQATIRKKAAKDEEYRKKVEQAGEIIDGIKENTKKVAKASQSLENRPAPKGQNLNFDAENEDGPKED